MRENKMRVPTPRIPQLNTNGSAVELRKESKIDKNTKSSFGDKKLEEDFMSIFGRGAL